MRSAPTLTKGASHFLVFAHLPECFFYDSIIPRALCNTKNASKQEKFYVARALAAQIHPGHKRMVYSHKHTLTHKNWFSLTRVCVSVSGSRASLSYYNVAFNQTEVSKQFPYFCIQSRNQYHPASTIASWKIFTRSTIKSDLPPQTSIFKPN